MITPPEPEFVIGVPYSSMRQSGWIPPEEAQALRERVAKLETAAKALATTCEEVERLHYHIDDDGRAVVRMGDLRTLQAAVRGEGR
jgi:hypothetical protein